MDKITKFLKKLSFKERDGIEHILDKIERRDIIDLDVKKLRGKENIFRVRKGSIRIIFLMKNHTTNIITIERRSDATY